MGVVLERYGHMGVSLMSTIIVILTAVLHLMAWFPRLSVSDVYMRDRRQQWLLGNDNFMHPEWIKWIWVALYIYQLVFAIYCFSVVCRSRIIEKSLRHVTHVTALLAYILGMLALIGWTLLKDSLIGHMHYFSGFAIFGASILFHAALSISISAASSLKGSLLSESKCDLFFSRVLVYNGVSAIASWATVITLFQIAQILDTFSILKLDQIRYIWLGFVAGYVFVFFLVGIIGTRRALEYTLSHYIIVLLAFAAVIVENQRKGQSDKLADAVIFVTAALMGFIGLLLFIALGVAIERGKKRETTEQKYKNLKLSEIAVDVIRESSGVKGSSNKL